MVGAVAATLETVVCDTNADQSIVPPSSVAIPALGRFERSADQNAVNPSLRTPRTW